MPQRISFFEVGTIGGEKYVIMRPFEENKKDQCNIEDVVEPLNLQGQI